MNVANEQLQILPCEIAFPPDDVTELPLLLPAEQVVQIEKAARRRGLTVGQMLRRAIQDLLNADRDALSCHR